MSTAGISAAWDFSRAKASELLVLLALGDQADDQGVCWPSEESLAARGRITDRQVRRCIEQLEARGEIEIWTYRRAGESFDRNAYRILLGPFTAYRGLDPKGLQTRGRVDNAELRVPPAIRRAVFERDGYRCVYCESTGRLSIDHKLPRSRGGTHELSNLQTLCVSCNASKGTATDEEYRLTGQLVRREANGNVRRSEDAGVLYAGAVLGGEPLVEPLVLSDESAHALIYRAIIAAFYQPSAALTAREKRQVALCATNILSAGGTAEMVPLVKRAYEKAQPTWAVTPMAVSGKWALFAPVSRGIVASVECEECGVGGGHHASGCARIAA